MRFFIIDSSLSRQMQKRALYPVIVGILGPGPRHDYHVQTTIEHLLMQSITFSDQSCDLMSDDAVSHLLTDRNSNPVPIKIIATHIQDQISVDVRLTGAIALTEILVFLQRFHSRFTLNITKKATLLRLSSCLSNGQFLSTLSSSGCKNLSSAGCAHSGSESMNLRALSFLGLICHFHV